MKIQLNPSAITSTSWREYATRFFFGGLVTVLAGLIAKHFGPVVGGLFLAFPAIFPASATFIEEQKKQQDRSSARPEKQAEVSVAADAAGAAAGSIALAAFAATVWRFLPAHSSWFTLGAATLAWFAVAMLCWSSLRTFWN